MFVSVSALWICGESTVVYPRTNACILYIHTVGESITEPHAQDTSADIVRMWLSGYILQPYIHTYMYNLYTYNRNKIYHLNQNLTFVA
jgi:hypothetical protein